MQSSSCALSRMSSCVCVVFVSSAKALWFKTCPTGERNKMKWSTVQLPSPSRCSDAPWRLNRPDRKKTSVLRQQRVKANESTTAELKDKLVTKKKDVVDCNNPENDVVDHHAEIDFMLSEIEDILRSIRSSLES